MGKQRHFWFDYLQEKRQVLRSDTDIERLDDKREGRAEGGRRFQREGPITEKDLDMANKQNFIFNASRDLKPMEMFLDVGRDMGVTGKSGDEYYILYVAVSAWICCILSLFDLPNKLN